MGVDAKKLVKCGGDMFKDSLHGDVSQFMKLDMTETSSIDIVMDSSNIGKCNKAIDSLGEVELEFDEDANIVEGMEKNYKRAHRSN